jgi:hypothetical protein
MKSIRLPRRAFLTGMGATVALPALDAMFDGRGLLYGTATQKAAAAEPTKFIVVHWPYGVPWTANAQGDQMMEFWFPRATQNVSPFTTTPTALAPLLENGPYGNFRSHFNVVSGLTMSPITYPGDVCSHGHSIAVFTGVKTVLENGGCTETGGGPSVDSVAAKAFGEPGPLAMMIPTGNYSRRPRKDANGNLVGGADYGGDYWTWSHSARATPNPIIWLPSQLLGSVFTTNSMESSEQQRIKTREKSVLDFVKRDSERLRGRLGSADRKRLDEHLETIRSLETSILGGATCADPGLPPDNYSFLDGTPFGDFDRYMQDMIRLGVLALKCGARRTLFLSMSSSQNDDGRWNNVGNHSYAIHACQHGDADGNSNAAGAAQYQAINVWMMKQLAYMFSQLTADPVGGATTLDSSVLVATSEFTNGYHDVSYMPVIVAGKAKAMTTGQNIAYANTESTAPSWARTLPGRKNPCMNDLWRTALVAAGGLGPSDAFAAGSGYNAQLLSELWQL